MLDMEEERKLNLTKINEKSSISKKGQAQLIHCEKNNKGKKKPTAVSGKSSEKKNGQATLLLSEDNVAAAKDENTMVWRNYKTIGQENVPKNSSRGWKGECNHC
jgi:hypothetical protein